MLAQTKFETNRNVESPKLTGLLLCNTVFIIKLDISSLVHHFRLS